MQKNFTIICRSIFFLNSPRILKHGHFRPVLLLSLLREGDTQYCAATQICCLQTWRGRQRDSSPAFCLTITLCSRNSSGFTNSFALSYTGVRCGALTALSFWLQSCSFLLLMDLNTIKHVPFLFMGNVTNKTNHQTAVSAQSKETRICWFFNPQDLPLSWRAYTYAKKYIMESNLNSNRRTAKPVIHSYYLTYLFLQHTTESRCK